MDEVNKQLSTQHSMYQEEYANLQRLVGADGIKQKKVNTAAANLKILAKNIQTLSADQTKLNEAWLRVPTGKISRKKGVASPKTVMVRTWHILPDEAVFHVTWAEEANRAKFDTIIKQSSVDFELLRIFHATRSESSASRQHSYVKCLSRQVDAAKDQSFSETSFVGMNFAISSAAKKECHLCKDISPSVKGRQDKFGVECSQQHFVCSACYQALARKFPGMCLSAKEAQQHYLARRKFDGILECNANNCFAFFCRTTGVQFPLYWKKLDTQHCDFVENHFMVDRLQLLIRGSVRPECGEGCRGRDGNGHGITSATVTRVLRIENGPLWAKYYSRKQLMIKNATKSKFAHLPAKTMRQFASIFPNVQANLAINEMFLFHGTREDAAFSIAKGGFDPTKASLAGLYGAGTYAADYSCKAMQYTPDQDEIRVFVICRVLMGSAYPCTQLLPYYKEPPEVNGKVFDSVHAEEGVSNDGQQIHNEYVTYDPDQGKANCRYLLTSLVSAFLVLL